MALVGLGLVGLLLSGVPHGHASRRVLTERGPCADHVWMGGATVLRSRASSPTCAGCGRPCRPVAVRGAWGRKRSLARSYACGYRSPTELEPGGRARLPAQSGQSAIELLCALLQQTLPSTHTPALRRAGGR